MVKLTLADTEYLGTTDGTNTLGCRTFILQRNGLRVLDFHFSPTFHAVRLHFRTSFIVLPSSVANIMVFVNTIWVKKRTI